MMVLSIFSSQEQPQTQGQSQGQTQEQPTEQKQIEIEKVEDQVLAKSVSEEEVAVMPEEEDDDDSTLTIASPTVVESAPKHCSYGNSLL